MSRPSVATIKRLFAVSGNTCAFPGCANPLIDAASGKVTARICHIKARQPEGPRYDPTQSEAERHAFDNLWACSAVRRASPCCGGTAPT